VPTRVYQAEMPRDKGQVERLLADVRAGRIAVLVAAYPDCFSTPFLKRLVAAGAGLACYNDL
jgi:hypothetical protein